MPPPECRADKKALPTRSAGLSCAAFQLVSQSRRNNVEVCVAIAAFFGFLAWTDQWQLLDRKSPEDFIKIALAVVIVVLTRVALHFLWSWYDKYLSGKASEPKDGKL